MSPITITALRDPIAIVHLPVSAAAAHASAIYWTLDRAASCEFFNLTSNRIEIAIFAPTHIVSDEWAPTPPLSINGPWRVFEITSGDDSGSNDSPHLRTVAAPLAAAGVSILYQSSYFTDFLLVKGSDFERAADVFRTRGWHIDPSTPRHTPRSLDMGTDRDRGGPRIAELTVLGAPLACIGLNGDMERTLSERIRKLLVWPERAARAIHHAHHGGGDKRHRPFVSFTRTGDGSSLLTEVRVLKSILTASELADLAAPELDGSDGGSDWSAPEERGDSEDGDGDGVEVEMTSDSGRTASPLSPRSPTSATSESSRRHSYCSQHALPPTPSREPVPIHWASAASPSPPSTPGSAGSRRKASLSPTRYRSRSGLGHSRTLSEGGGLPRRATEGAVPAWQGWKRKREGGGEVEEAQEVEECDEDDDGVESDAETQRGSEPGTLRCLQLDLRTVEGTGMYHLDKSGLVIRFSQLLHAGGVRMLYSSTTYTANVLVQERDVAKAERLLRS